MPRRILTAAFLYAALAAPAPALADGPTQTPGTPLPPVPANNQAKGPAPSGRAARGPRVTESLRIAHAFWEAQPHGCSKGITVYDAFLLDEFGGVTIPGESCAMWIGHGYFTGHTADDRVDTCDEIVREYGRLVGARRSWHPRAIMNPATSATVWGCDHRFAPRARGHRSPLVWATR